MNRQTVVETPSYIVLAGKLFTERERDGIVAMVAENPQCGDVMSGTGGFRKVRRFHVRAVPFHALAFAAARVVYIWRNDKFPAFLITVFPKNRKANLTKAERNALKKRSDDIFDRYRR